MRFRLLMFGLILIGAFAAVIPDVTAQTPHPCDITPSAGTLRPTDPFGIGFCHTLKDRAGNAQPPQTVPKLARVLIDNIERYKGPIAPQGGPNVFGLTYFETPQDLTLAAGTHAIQLFVTADTALGESDAGTYSVTIAPALTRSSTPTRIRLIRGGQ